MRALSGRARPASGDLECDGADKDQFGRGPTKVRTNYAGPDSLVCLLEHTFTPAEGNLQAMGEHQRLCDIRTKADIASEMFVLHPETTSDIATP